MKYLSTAEEMAAYPVGEKATDPDGYAIVRVEGGWVYEEMLKPGVEPDEDDVWPDAEILERWGCVIVW